MKISLIKKLSLGFLLAVIGSIIISSFISNYMVSKKFNQYLMDEHTTKINDIIKTAEGLYDEKIGLSSSSKDEIQRYAVMQELYIEIKDLRGNLVYSSGNSNLQHKSVMESMMGSMMNNSFEINPGEYTENKYDLVKNQNKIGTITVGYYGTSYLSAGALSFKVALNQSFMLSAIIALVIGLVISIFLSKQLSNPLTKITKTANDMRKGNLEVRSTINTNTKEIYELKNSINYLAETLQHQEVLRKRLTTDMAHELRTPLTTLKTHIEALMDGIWEPSMEKFQVFYEEIERLTKLVDNLRNLSKLDQANLSLIKSNFNLSEEIEKIIKTFEPLYGKKDYELVSNIDPNIIVSMDRDKLKQIMYNLLSNSYKYLKPSGKVEVSLKSSSKNIIIEVKDNGIGIPQKDLPYIFERFYRTDISRNKNTGGSGIGLTITKSLIEAHGGSINVTSIEDCGTTFSIEFPKNLVSKNK